MIFAARAVARARAGQAATRGVRGKHYLLQYDYVEGILDKRGPHRPEHLDLAKAAYASKQLLLAGATADAKGAVFVWDCDDEQPIRDFVAADPYVKNDLVTGHTIKEWATVDLSAK